MKAEYIPECEIEKELAALQSAAAAANSSCAKTIKQEDEEDAITVE